MDIDSSGIRSLSDKVQEALEHSHELSTLELWGNLMENSPQNHGRLAGSWKYQQRGYLHSVVGTSVAYALIQNDGIDPFTIVPKNGKALYWPGADHPVKKVEHPGFAGSNYIEQSISEAEGRHGDFIRQALRGVDLI